MAGDLGYVHVKVKDDGKTGYLLSAESTEVVTFPKNKKAPPGEIVRCFLDANGRGRIWIESWDRESEYVFAETVRVCLSGDEDGLIGRANPDFWVGEQLDVVLRVDTADGSIDVVQKGYEEAAVTHFVFEDQTKEQAWIVARIRASQTVTSCSRGSVQLSRHFAGLLGKGEPQRVRVERNRDQLRDGLPELQRQVQVERQKLASIAAERKAAEADAAKERVRLEKAGAELARISEDCRSVERHVDALRREESEFEGKRASRSAQLAESDRELQRERSELESQVAHLRTQVRSGVLLQDRQPPDGVSSLVSLEPIGAEHEGDAICEAAKRLEGRVDAITLVGLHVALKHCPFVVLTGPSGSGKSSLLSAYARVFGIASEVIAVQPNWTSSADLHGFVTPIGAVRHFVSTPFSDVLGLQYADGTQASADGAEAPFLSLAILDEINLSHVEYYLADYLSALESDDREVVVASPLEIEDALVPMWLRRSKGRARLPFSFLMAGTANEDHTTRSFSDKFRDRAALLEVKPRSFDVVSVDSVKARVIKPLGRVTPSAWRAWRKIPEASSMLQNQMVEANKALGVLRLDGFHVGHRVVRDVNTMMRSIHPLVKGCIGRAKEKEAAVASLDLALTMRVVQKFGTLYHKRVGWNRDERNAALKRLGDAIPAECERARTQLRSMET